MNIKILEPIQDHLVAATFPFGSHVYETAGPTSDKDYIKILNKPSGELILQYQTQTVDYVYTDLNNFIHLATTGGNTPMYEVTLLEAFKDWYSGDPLVPDPYATAKAYLGLAKRDLHYPERHWHVDRGIWMAEQIMSGSRIELSEVKNIPYGHRSPAMLSDYINELRIKLNKQFKKT
jgi:hypothetical protein